jgi:glycine/D-amino acid oxidase-like deaminating enzyme
METHAASLVDGSTPRYADCMASPDVIVVGGGIIGCATAAELAGVGLNVTLLERAEIASAASGRNHGLVFQPQDPLLIDLYKKSQEMYFKLAKSTEVDFDMDLEPRGMLIAVATEDEWILAEEEIKAYEAGEKRVHRLGRKDLFDLEPELSDSHLGGFLVEDAHRLDPAALTLAFALEARRLGAQVQTHTDVKQILIRGNKVRGVASDAGIIEAPMVIDAAGPWAPKLARTIGIDLPIRGARGWLLLTNAVDEIARHLIEAPGWRPPAGDPGPAESTVGEYARGETTDGSTVGLLIQQNRSGNILLGGSRVASMRDDPERVEVTVEIAQRAVKTLPALERAPIAAIWSGIRPVTSDGLPLIGRITEVEGFFVAGGHSGQGVILGGGTARLVAETIAGKTPFTTAAPFDPMRQASTTFSPA